MTRVISTALQKVGKKMAARTSLQTTVLDLQSFLTKPKPSHWI